MKGYIEDLGQVTFTNANSTLAASTLPDTDTAIGIAKFDDILIQIDSKTLGNHNSVNYTIQVLATNTENASSTYDDESSPYAEWNFTAVDVIKTVVLTPGPQMIKFRCSVADGEGAGGKRADVLLRVTGRG